MEPTTKVLFSRQDYLGKKCTHREYYAQFVTPQVFNRVSFTFGYNLLRTAFEADEHFNTIPLRRWDAIGVSSEVAKLMKEANDFLTPAGKVCILKEAARQIVEL